jgi:hypothetical protein
LLDFTFVLPAIFSSNKPSSKLLLQAEVHALSMNNTPSHQVDFFYLNEQVKTLSPKRSRAEINPHPLNEMDGQD